MMQCLRCCQPRPRLLHQQLRNQIFHYETDAEEEDGKGREGGGRSKGGREGGRE